MRKFVLNNTDTVLIAIGHDNSIAILWLMDKEYFMKHDSLFKNIALKDEFLYDE